MQWSKTFILMKANLMHCGGLLHQQLLSTFFDWSYSEKTYVMPFMITYEASPSCIFSSFHLNGRCDINIHCLTRPFRERCIDGNHILQKKNSNKHDEAKGRLETWDLRPGKRWGLYAFPLPLDLYYWSGAYVPSSW